MRTPIFYFLLTGIFLSEKVKAQDASLKARTDAVQITVGDQVKFFIEAQHDPQKSSIQWATIPDTFNTLEIVERGKIDTNTNGNLVIYKQRLLITGFDSGLFKIPAFAFTIVPKNGTPYTLHTDSFQILVQTVPVDTTQPFKGIKDIIVVKRSWQDYIWLIVGVVLLVALVAIVILYFRKNKKMEIVVTPKKPVETPDARALRLFDELQQQQLWQSNRIKEYYVRLTDILRSYIEERFHTPAMELTTDELLQKARQHPEMRPQYDRLVTILSTADLAKFAKAQPLPQEHTIAMDLSKDFVIQTKPQTPTNTEQQS